MKPIFKSILVHEGTKNQWINMKPAGVTCDGFARMLMDLWGRSNAQGISLDRLLRGEK